MASQDPPNMVVRYDPCARRIGERAAADRDGRERVRKAGGRAARAARGRAAHLLGLLSYNSMTLTPAGAARGAEARRQVMEVPATCPGPSCGRGHLGLILGFILWLGGGAAVVGGFIGGAAVVGGEGTTQFASAVYVHVRIFSVLLFVNRHVFVNVRLCLFVEFRVNMHVFVNSACS